MMSAPTGGRPKVIGSSMAMVASDPMPGSTPISVPTSAPIRQSTTLVGVTATPMPSQRFAMRSYMVVLADHQNRGQSWNGRFKP